MRILIIFTVVLIATNTSNGQQAVDGFVTADTSDEQSTDGPIEVISEERSQDDLENFIKDGFQKDRYWSTFDLKLWTYFINPNESISNENTLISAIKSESIKGLTFMENKKIFNLPIKVYKSFPNLMAYNAFNCSLKTVNRRNFHRLKELQFIGLAHNSLTFIAPNTFENTTNLKYLFLSNNKLKVIDEILFATLGNLRTLHLSHNEITLIPNNAFSSLVELRNISLSYNKIQRMDKNHFENNKKLERIWLNNNRIEFLSSAIFDIMPNIKTVNLDENRCVNGSANAENLQQLKEKIKQNC